MVDDAEQSRVSRDELAALERRLRELERAVAPRPQPHTRCEACGKTVVAGRFCMACGAPLQAAVPGGVASAVPTASPAPAPTAVPNASPTALPTGSPAAASAPPPRASLESAIGQQWAPRIGALLVLLGIVFFLGVAIQRGWIRPLAQLGIAVIAGGALVGAGAWLTKRRGYGAYPQILEATGASALYVTAFVAHALPYYRAETNLTQLGGGTLMAAVAVGTVALALHRDARLIAGLGFSLAFLTALLGFDVLPGLTLAYVALLGTALAVLVARRTWLAEGVLGAFATGGLLLALAIQGARTGDPAPGMVALVSLAPAAAFLWLAAQPARANDSGATLAALLTLATFAWASATTVAAVEGITARGALLLTWALAAVAHAAFAGRSGAGGPTLAASGIAAVVLWLLGAPLAWSAWTDAELLTTGTYALAALATTTAATRLPESARSRTWNAALALALAAAAYALTLQGLLHPPWENARGLLGPWQAWLTLALVAAPLALLLSAEHATPQTRRAAFWLAAFFGAAWAFALFTTPLATTMWLLLVAAALVTVAAAGPRANAVADGAMGAALAVLALAAVKTATLDAHLPGVRLNAGPALLASALVAGTMLALFHLATTRRLLTPGAMPASAIALVGGSALVLANHILVYAEGGWISILLGALGVGYLTAGFARGRMQLYRYTAFAILGFVLLRAVLVDMRETDLAIRALVFAVLGAALLGIGYAYARLARQQEPATAQDER